MSAEVLPSTAENVAECVRSFERVYPGGAGTKTALAAPPAGFVRLDLRGLSGILAYDPGEFTVTALAGTPLSVIEEALARHGQHLPFDPPLGAAGATLGGTIASGLSGPGRYRFGGLRDFILQVQYVSGKGELARGGAKVVKNSAGFDLPKLLVGSLGRLAILTEATFKVFPAPRSFATVQAELPNFETAMQVAQSLGRPPFDIEALEIDPPGVLSVRISRGGVPAASSDVFDARLTRLEAAIGGKCRRLQGDAERSYWRNRRDAIAPLEGSLVAKVGLSPARAAPWQIAAEKAGATCRYSSGGHIGWLTWPHGEEELRRLLAAHNLAGLILQGPPAAHPLLGAVPGQEFLRRVKAALDPEGKFPPF